MPGPLFNIQGTKSMTHCKEIKDYSLIFRFMAALAPLSREFGAIK